MASIFHGPPKSNSILANLAIVNRGGRSAEPFRLIGKGLGFSFEMEDFSKVSIRFDIKQDCLVLILITRFR